MPTVRIHLPPRLRLDRRIGQHRLQQLLEPAELLDAHGEPLEVGRGSVAWRIDDYDRQLWLVRYERHAPDGAVDVLLTKESLSYEAPPEAGYRWRPSQEPGAAALLSGEVRNTVASTWRESLSLRESVPDHPGLRAAQLGAVHGVLSHWTVSNEPATVVMPTGTGKTDSMIALMVHQAQSPLMVVVPTSPLRRQTAEKLMRLGILRECEVLSSEAQLPVVGTITGGINSAELDELLSSSNVLVSTMQALTRWPHDLIERLRQELELVFIDEAHHVAAPTWSRFRDALPDVKIVQMTATPFRGDDKLVRGRVAYRYPLSKAQDEGLFTPITFRSVFELDPAQSHAAIAEAALDQLDDDLAAGHDHVLMARASTQARADEIAETYRASTEHGVEVVHTGISPAERNAAIERVRSAESRIVVCVDMLGEGFDMPTLKIAAFHDPHRSLSITLQFIGRFTRAASNIGEATVIANRADDKMERSIAGLYAEDAEWNSLLRELTENAVGRQLRRLEFLENFPEMPEGVPVQSIYPKMSTLIYRTPSAVWNPQHLPDRVGGSRVYTSALNAVDHVAVVVTYTEDRPPWTESTDVRNITWDLYLLYFDPGAQLLFIHSSDTSKLYGDLAEAVCGEAVTLIEGKAAYRVLSGINRLLVRNVGLRHVLNRSVRFTMHSGPDVYDYLTEAHLENKTPSNIFGFGYEDGERSSAGCSTKGRVWAYRVSQDIGEWTDWCDHIGRKVLDETVDLTSIIRTTVKTDFMPSRPPERVPLEIEWSDNVYARPEDTWRFNIGESPATLLDTGLEVVDRDADGPIRFRIFNKQAASTFELAFSEDQGVQYRPIVGPQVEVREARRPRISLQEWFAQEPPTIWFHDGTYLIGSYLHSAPSIRGDHPFDDGDVETWDWAGVNIRKEALGDERAPDSIQRHVIDRLIAGGDFAVVYNDDGSHEVADVVAIGTTSDVLKVRLFHLKHSHGDEPGARVDDLYEVCGQAVKSAHWKGRRDRALMFDHLLRREAAWNRNGRSRIEHGDGETLHRIARVQDFLEPDYEIILVQPGLSKAAMSNSQRSLLGTTALFLAETFNVPLRVVGNP